MQSADKRYSEFSRFLRIFVVDMYYGQDEILPAEFTAFFIKAFKDWVIHGGRG